VLDRSPLRVLGLQQFPERQVARLTYHKSPCDNDRQCTREGMVGFVPSTKQKFYSWSHDAVICAFDVAGNVIETHEHKGDFKEPSRKFCSRLEWLVWLCCSFY
jgi:hypothetical protein